MHELGTITKKQHPPVVRSDHSMHVPVPQDSQLSSDLFAADVNIKNRHERINQTNHNCNHKPENITQHSGVNLS